MPALDIATFDVWKEEHQRYLDTKFDAVCGKLDTVRQLREEDCARCIRMRTECQADIDDKVDLLNKADKSIKRMLVAGLIFTSLITTALEGHIALEAVYNTITGWLLF